MRKATPAKTSTEKALIVKTGSSPLVTDGVAWRALAPPALAAAPEAMMVGRLLERLNGATFHAAGGVWHCKAEQLFEKPSPVPKKARGGMRGDEPQGGQGGPGGAGGAGAWSLLFSLGGARCLCVATLPAGLRAKLERLSEPYALEELPVSVVAGLLTLELAPLLQELFSTPCRLLEHAADAENLLSFEGASLTLSIEAREGEGEDKGEGDFLRLCCHLAASDMALEALGEALRIRQRQRHYPQQLHTTWQLEAGGTSLSLEEFQALEEGDVLLLS